jgi:chromosome segregation ATPase/predicted RNA-binding Zn-ribbon protein involved in translation (DUF1610 family)
MLAEAEIKFECSQCRQRLAVEAAGAGLKMNCPTCSHLMIVPLASTRRSGSRMKAPREDGPIAMRPARAPGAEGEAHTLREELVQSGVLAGQLERDLAEAQSETARLRRQIEAATAERDALSAAVGEARKEIERLTAERTTLLGDLELNRHRLAATESHLAARQRELGEITASIARAAGEAEAARNAAQEMKQECARLQGALESTRAALEAARRVEDDFARARQRVAELAMQLDTAESARAELAAERETLKRENTALRRDLGESREGRELLALREQARAAEAEQQRTSDALRQAETEAAKLAEAERRLRAELDALGRRCLEAERQAEAMSDSKVQRDNDVLRGILERQKAELERRYAEAQRYRRAHLGLRLIYAAVTLGVVAVIGLAIKVLPAAF